MYVKDFTQMLLIRTANTFKLIVMFVLLSGMFIF